MSRWRLGICLSALSIFATGCFSLAHPYPSIVDYAIDSPAVKGSAAAAKPEGVILKVRAFRVASLFDSRKFIYRKPGAAWESDFYNEFLITPGPMIGTDVERRLAESGAAGEVAPGTSQLSPTHELEGTVQELFGDYSDAAAPKAVMTIEIVLLDERAGAPRIALHKTYREAAALAAATPEALIEGWEKDLAAIMAALEGDLATASWNPGAKAAAGAAAQ